MMRYGTVIVLVGIAGIVLVAEGFKIFVEGSIDQAGPVFE